MGKTTYKLGQLVYCIGGGFNKGNLGNIVSIIDRESKELYSEKEVITGCGEKNTRVNIEIDIIAGTREIWDITSSVVGREKVRIIHDPHNVILMDPEYFEGLYKKALDTMNHKLEFIKKHSVTRDDKINTILNG